MAKVSKAEQEQEKARLAAATAAVLVTTGELQAKSQPLEIVFAVGSAAGSQEAFLRARTGLQVAAVALGGHAVTACRFAYHSVATQTFGCSSSVFVVSGYGTVVRFV
jgi:hypothetical protein